MGYVEETGAAQHLRDARISPIYEGTNGIQAADLVGRKLGLEGGGVLAGLLADIRAEAGGEANLHGPGRRLRGRSPAHLLASGPDDRLAALLSVPDHALGRGRAAGCWRGSSRRWTAMTAIPPSRR